MGILTNAPLAQGDSAGDVPQKMHFSNYCVRVEPRRVLFVCTANICRSPTAELLARSRFGEETVMFRSAGLLESGRSMPKELDELLAERSISTMLHRSHQMDPATLEAAELILTMEGRHVQEIAIASQSAFRKTIPLLHAASMQRAGLTFDEFLSRIEDRDATQYLSTEWDVDDPYKRGKRRYRKMVQAVDELLDAVIAPLL